MCSSGYSVGWISKEAIRLQATHQEYGFYIERCFPISDDRRMFFESKVSSARPGTGYGLLALLAEKRRLASVWTTNFDGLPSRAAAAANVPVYKVGLDSSERLARLGRHSGLVSVAMHGDYRYDQLRNTPSELREADARIREHLALHVRDTSLIVIGYSGRDESVMATLEEAFRQPGGGALYWCAYTDAMPPRVENLLRSARAAGRGAYFVVAQGFDDLLWRICVQSLPAEDQDRVRELASAMRSGPTRARFGLPSWPTTGFIKSNAFAVECPAELFEVELTDWPADQRAWEFIDASCAGKDIAAAPFKGKILAFGTIDDLKAAFAPRFKSIVRTPISGRELEFEDGVVVNLLRKALVRSMAASAGVESDSRKVLWERTPFEYHRVNDRKVGVHHAAICFLRRIAETMYLVVKPTLLITEPDGTKASREVSQPIVMQKLGYQHNAEFNQVMLRWRKTLFTARTTFEFPPSGASFRFVVRKSPAFVTIRSQVGRRITVPPEIAAHVRHDGFELPEPKLLFSTPQGHPTVAEPHPIRGVVENRPYDYSLTVQGFAPSVSLGVVCPASHDNEASRFFSRLHQRQPRQQSDAEYLVDFPGFQAMFHLPLDVPRPGESRWAAGGGADGHRGRDGGSPRARHERGEGDRAASRTWTECGCRHHSRPLGALDQGRNGRSPVRSARFRESILRSEGNRDAVSSGEHAHRSTGVPCHVVVVAGVVLQEHEDAVGSERPERRNGLCGTGFQHRQACRERLEDHPRMQPHVQRAW